MTLFKRKLPSPISWQLELHAVAEGCWEALEQGAALAGSAFHTPVVGTTTATGCGLRTVVLRQVYRDQRALYCHTDARSPKVSALDDNRALSWLFYDREQKVQIRAEGIATVHRTDSIANTQWARSSLSSRRCYRTLTAPGAVQPSPASGLPPELEERVPTLEESEIGRPHFAVIACRIDKMDWLHLAARGHSRATFRWTAPEQGWRDYEASWVIP